MNIGNIIYGINGNTDKPSAGKHAQPGTHSQPSADDYRYSVIRALATSVPTDVRTLIDWHAGKQPHKDKRVAYSTCGLQVMNVAAGRGMTLDCHVSEIDDDRRDTLAQAIVAAGHDRRPGWNVTITKDWRENIRKYVGYANERSISIVDPDMGTDFYEGNLFVYVVPAMFSNSHCLIHMHEHLRLDIHKRMVRKIADVARNAGRNGIDLYHLDAEDDDFVHHNFVLTDLAGVAACEQAHLAMLNKDPCYARNPYDGGAKRIVPANDDAIDVRGSD